MLARPLALSEAVAVDDFLAIGELETVIISVVVGHEFGILLQQVFLEGAPLKDQAIPTIVSAIRVANAVSRQSWVASFAPLELPRRCTVLGVQGKNERKQGKKGNRELHGGATLSCLLDRCRKMRTINVNVDKLRSTVRTKWIIGQLAVPVVNSPGSDATGTKNRGASPSNVVPFRFGLSQC